MAERTRITREINALIDLLALSAPEEKDDLNVEIQRLMDARRALDDELRADPNRPAAILVREFPLPDPDKDRRTPPRHPDTIL